VNARPRFIWFLALVVCFCGCYCIQPAVRMINSLRAGIPIRLGPALYTETWWLPLSCFAVGAFSVSVAISIVRMRRHSWVHLTAFWLVFAIFVLVGNVLAMREIHHEEFVYGTALIAIMALSVYYLRKLESRNAL
jgi:uncharacterized membrane protein YoaK (UPF0700 family)